MLKAVAATLTTLALLVLILIVNPQVTTPDLIANTDGLRLYPPKVTEWGAVRLVGAFLYNQTHIPKLVPTNLKVYPWGHINATWHALPSKQVEIVVYWKTDVGKGAGEVYIGYSLDGAHFEEVGPFGESAELRIASFNIKAENGLIVRWRGRDLDLRDAAFGYVGFELRYGRIV